MQQQKEQTGELYFRDHGLERTTNSLLYARNLPTCRFSHSHGFNRGFWGGTTKELENCSKAGWCVAPGRHSHVDRLMIRAKAFG